MQQLKSGSFLQGGKYKIERVLGQGGFGITYLATQELLNRKVAIKEFFYKEYCERDEETSHVSLGTSSNRELVERFMEKFIKEARTISALNHPHIIRIYDIFKENNTAYYVMEYIEGMSLAEMVKRQGVLPENMAIDYIKQTASALEFVHRHSINHLDVKPANIMVRKEDNQAVLIDFGLSKQYDASGEQTSTTPVGISHGYAPMEQYNVGGVGTFSPQTDIYSLGATLYKLVTGNTPPQAGEVLNEGLPELPSFVSSSVADVIKKAMQPRKVDRYHCVNEFLSSLNVVTHTEDEETQIIQELEPKVVKDKTPWYIIGCTLIITLLVLITNVTFRTVSTDSNIPTIDSLALVEQQRINDSIANIRLLEKDSIAEVRRQEVEQRRKDSIVALNEQARLATVRKLDEEQRKKDSINAVNEQQARLKAAHKLEEERKRKQQEEARKRTDESKLQGRVDNQKVFLKVDELPEFPGGIYKCMEFIHSKLQYPQKAVEQGIQGRVIVAFVVNHDGSIAEPEIVQSIDPYLDKEALRVISIMPKWKPGKLHGKIVRCRFTVPVSFKLIEQNN